MLAGSQGDLCRNTYSTTAVVITAIVEKMKLTEFRLDLPHCHRHNIRVPIQMFLQGIAKSQEDPSPSGIAVDVFHRWIREELRVSRPKFFNCDIW
jgi:hypothetical protein